MLLVDVVKPFLSIQVKVGHLHPQKSKPIHADKHSLAAGANLDPPESCLGAIMVGVPWVSFPCPFPPGSTGFRTECKVYPHQKHGWERQPLFHITFSWQGKKMYLLAKVPQSIFSSGHLFHVWPSGHKLH